MSTTAQQILDASIARSSATEPNLQSTGAPEILRVINKALLSKFMLAAHRSSVVFADAATLDFAADPGGWLLPDECLVPIGAIGTDGTDPTSLDGVSVRLVRFDDRAQAAGEPSVYLFGRYLYPSGNSDDPVGGELQLQYARKPEQCTGLQLTIDAEWPEQFNALLELPVATYLARKDGRTEDIAVFTAEEGEWLALFDAWLGGQTLFESSRFGEFRGLDLKPRR